MTTAHHQFDDRLTKAAQRLSAICGRNEVEMAIYGFLVGALYGLRKAVTLGFRDRTGSALPADYSDEIRRVARVLMSSDNVEEKDWLAGFYFNSALQRLAPVCERLGEYASMRQDLVPGVRQEVNRMKHDAAGVLGGRTVGLSDAIDAAYLLVAAVEVLFNPGASGNSGSNTG